MGIVKFGSARSSESGGTNGIKGDQKGGKEVSIQDYYMHDKGWIAIRAVNSKDALALAQAMKDACNNDLIGYGQADRDDVIKQLKGGKILKNIDVPCNCDCSSLVRACIYEAMHFDVGQFNTANEASVIMNSGKFMKYGISSEADCKLGDILVTKTQGHTVICTEGFVRADSSPVDTVNVQFKAPVLKRGSLGKMVKLWQVLVGAGVDGSFGTETDLKTRQFQTSHDLASTGIVDEKTWNKAMN